MPILAKNKKASFNYDLIEKFEGGLVLTGAEVKSAKSGNIHMQGSYLTIQDGELWLKNMHIGKYLPAGKDQPEPKRIRKVLVHKSEIKKMIGKHEAEGLTLVPISVYTKANLVKISFALARGKKKYEKREAIKKRDIDRRMKEEMKKLRRG